MALHRIQADTGATIKPGPMEVAPPERVVTDDAHAALSEATGLNGPFVADLLSSFVTHERCGVNLFRALGAQTQNPLIRPPSAGSGVTRGRRSTSTRRSSRASVATSPTPVPRLA